MFQAVSGKLDFPAMEKDVLAFWDARGTFKASIERRRGGPEFVFYDGPPFATGLPHYGHLLAGTIKDIVPRYQTMRGYLVNRRFGWDCHGLPIEALAQEALGLAGASAIVEKGVDIFNEQCRSMVSQYVGEWRKTVERMGRWVDFDDDYKTMDLTFMETIWWVFKRLWDQGRVYKAYRIMPYSWKLATPLSNFEAGNNYKDVQDPAITIRLKLTGGPAGTTPSCYALAWTTTPWTLPGNLALCVGPDIDYVLVKDAGSGDHYLLAEARLETCFKQADAYGIVARYKGRDLRGWTYEPLFPYFADRTGAFRILNDEFVSTDDGTGIVHMAPAYGEDDYRVCRAEGIDIADPLDSDCRFTSQVPDYAGQFCKDADKAIIRRLKAEGKLVHQSTLVHSYPFCERTDTPLIYRAIDAWYVRVEDLRDRMVEHNRQIHWVPDYVGEKRFGNWLKEAKDWNISRNRFWGSCIPVWVAEDGSDTICVGSIDELEKLSGVRVRDLHKHSIDPVTFRKNGKLYRRTPEVLDCWFESGAMPYAQSHYPFENRERFESHFPADFIAEGLDQTRGWFYTLMILSTALFDRPAFQNVVVNGLVLTEDGRKMSKRLKNYPDPNHILDEYGADALRLYMISSPVVRAEDLCFSEEGVKHALRHLLIPWWNAYSFFVTYANIDGWTPDSNRPEAGANVLDGWVRSSLETLVAEVTSAMDTYDLQRAVRPFVRFIEDLTNWYIRRSRRRFWKSRDDEDKRQAYQTLNFVLLQLCKVAAPFVPFISEAIYRNLRTADMPESVHLCDFPTVDGGRRDPALEARMDLVLTVVRLGRLLRTEHDLKVRQPLATLHIVSRDEALTGSMRDLVHLILDELNVKEVRFGTHEHELVHLQAKPDFKRLGPRFGAKVKDVAKAVGAMDSARWEELSSNGTVTIDVKGEVVTLDTADVVLDRIPRPGLVVAAEGPLVVALETALTPELEAEGLAREFVNKVQNMRKTGDFEVSQRVRTEYATDDPLADAIARFSDYVCTETLTVECVRVDTAQADAVQWDVNGHACAIRVTPAAG